MAITLRESISIGLSDFWSRKIRSLITIFGIILGTMSVIVVLALVNGANQDTLKWMMERGGLAKISIYRNWQYDNPNNLPSSFNLKEINLIKSLIPEALYFNPSIDARAEMSYQKNKYYSRIYGVMPDFSKVEEWGAEAGRFIAKFDVDNSNDVICIGTTIRDELFGNKNPIGQYITVQGRRLKVIGVMKHRFLENNGSFGNNNGLSYMNRRCYVPISTMISKGTGSDEIDYLVIKAATVAEAPQLKRKLEAILLNLRHGEPIFRLESAQEEAENMKKDAAKFQVIFFLISAISLFVGGIVIMNIMLATVQERTREIGIRMAIGARQIDVFIQFIVQTVIITTIGGILGIVIELSLLDVLGKYLEFNLVASQQMVGIALFVSAGVGLLFGIFPAVRASKLDPVEALRHE